MVEAPLVIVAGGDTLIESVCKDLQDAGQRVVVVWESIAGFRERVERCGATFIGRSPSDRDALLEAGIAQARALLALDLDDRINLEVAMQAREANPNVRIVLRQFNRTLARKIERNLPNCSVISLAAHSAATYAAAAVERSTFLGIEFPAGSRSLVSFARKSATDAGVDGLSPRDAERRLGCRILARDPARSSDDSLEANEELVLLGPLEAYARVAPALQTERGGLSWIGTRMRAIASEFDPLLRILLVAGAGVFLAASVYFAFALHLNPITAAYFVITTMTTVGYGDIALADKGHVAQVVGMGLMISGVIVSNLVIAFVAAALVRAQWTALQGLRPVRDSGHIIVIGAGRVGTRVIDYLCELRVRITVVELKPTPELVRRARGREISLLTGDGTLDDTLDLCNLATARSAVVVTDSDATNLEVGFGARARRSDIPVIMRVAEPAFAAAIRVHFEIRRVFSATALASSAFSDLVDSPAARGRVSFGAQTYRIVEYAVATDADRRAMVVAACAANEPLRLVRSWDDVAAGDAVLALR
jgi:Trk K+ transport system NAD-binding subunit